jgi:hypothetical protein
MLFVRLLPNPLVQNPTPRVATLRGGVPPGMSSGSCVKLLPDVFVTVFPSMSFPISCPVSVTIPAPIAPTMELFWYKP